MSTAGHAEPPGVAHGEPVRCDDRTVVTWSGRRPCAPRGGLFLGVLGAEARVGEDGAPLRRLGLEQAPPDHVAPEHGAVREREGSGRGRQAPCGCRRSPSRQAASTLAASTLARIWRCSSCRITGRSKPSHSVGFGGFSRAKAAARRRRRGSSRRSRPRGPGTSAQAGVRPGSRMCRRRITPRARRRGRSACTTARAR